MGNFTGHGSVKKPDGLSPESWMRFTCGHCGRAGSGAVVARYAYQDEGGKSQAVFHLACTACGKGSVINPISRLSPGIRFGPALEGLPENIEEAYTEARDCMSISAFTAAELICRKILMHTAVDKGAKEGKTFVSYIDYLADAGYVTPPMKPWVDLIREHGNESAHKLPQPDEDRAEATVMFTAELLRLVYEMDHMTKKYAKPDDEDLSD